MQSGRLTTAVQMRAMLLLSGAAIALVGAPLAAAQTGAQSAEMDEIIVTAQKREQSLQDVPISIQVVDDQFIRDLAADDMSDISQFIPGLDVGAGSPTQPRYKIRGINTSDFGVGTDPAVGVYVDGIYSARSGAAVLAFNDIERIEVLKGPQGTLFGRNSAAGAVSIITKKPNADEFDGSVGLRLGNYGKRRAEAMVNVPISDQLALRVNGLYNQRDGLFDDAATGEDLSTQKNWAARAALGWTPTDATNAVLSWTHDDLDQDARPAIGIVPLPAAPGTPPVPTDPASYLNPLNAPVYNDVRNNHETRELDEVSLTINHDFSDITLTSITSWRKFETENREDEDGTNRIDLYFDTANREKNKSWYQEFRLAGETNSVNWLVGASYFNEDAKQVSDTFTFTDTVNTSLGNIGFGTPFTDLEYGLLVPNGIPLSLLGHDWREAVYNKGKYSAWAVYADVIWPVTDKLNLTFGGRYTDDAKEFHWLNGGREAPGLDSVLGQLDAMGLLALAGTSPAAFQFDLVFDQNGLAGVPCDNGVSAAEGVTCIMDRSWDNFSPRLVADYAFTDHILGFASYSKGYKAGGFNSVELASVFENEDVTSFEAGLKTEFPDANFLFNISGFQYTYNDKQSISLGTVAGSSVPQYLVQTSDDEAWGIDLESSWYPVEALRLFGNAQYIDATYKRRVLDDGTDLSGEPTGEPKLSAAIGARYERDMSFGGRLAAQAALSHRSKNRSNSGSAAQGSTSTTSVFKTGGAQNRTDLRLSWTSENERFEWGVYANNVFDKQYVTGINNLTSDTLGTPFASITDPMFWGSDLKINF